MKVVSQSPKSWKIGVVKEKDGSKTYLDYFPSWGDEPKLVENFIFDAVLKPDDFYRGRSAAGFYFKDSDDGSKFTMRISKVSELLDGLANGSVKVVNGGFKARYTFAKQGANYTIQVYEEKKK